MINTRAAEQVAAEVRAMAARKRYTQTRVATVLGCSQAAVSRLFRGEVAFDIAELFALAEEWDVPITTLIGTADSRSTTDGYDAGSSLPALPVAA